MLLSFEVQPARRKRSLPLGMLILRDEASFLGAQSGVTGALRLSVGRGAVSPRAPSSVRREASRPSRGASLRRTRKAGFFAVDVDGEGAVEGTVKAVDEALLIDSRPRFDVEAVPPDATVAGLVGSSMRLSSAWEASNVSKSTLTAVMRLS